MKSRVVIGWLCCLWGVCAAAERHLVGPAEFDSVLPSGNAAAAVHVERFQLDQRPVTNAEYLAFVTAQPQWRRDRVPRLFADGDYLTQWIGADRLGAAAQPDQPVTRVSWFAARAYCEAAGGRLPSWYEWEMAAAADEHQPDARRDMQWQSRILDWYAQPAGHPLAHVGSGPPNFYGIQDLHGLVWEWVDDFNALIVSGDSREQGDPDKLKFCGAGALSLKDRENYAVLMRVAFLSSLEARSTAHSLGFRCAAGYDQPVSDVIPGDSLYQLPVALQSSDGRTLKLADLRGVPLVVAMFYGHCSSVCPLLTAQVQRLIGELSPAERQKISILLVSFDSLRDTPESLTAFKAEHHIQEPNWMVARTSASDVRALAAALGIRYRELSDHTFNHSAIISVTDRDGVVRARTSDMSGPDAGFVAAIRARIAAGDSH